MQTGQLIRSMSGARPVDTGSSSDSTNRQPATETGDRLSRRLLARGGAAVPDNDRRARLQAVER